MINKNNNNNNITIINNDHDILCSKKDSSSDIDLSNNNNNNNNIDQSNNNIELSTNKICMTISKKSTRKKITKSLQQTIKINKSGSTGSNETNDSGSTRSNGSNSSGTNGSNSSGTTGSNSSGTTGSNSSGSNETNGSGSNGINESNETNGSGSNSSGSNGSNGSNEINESNKTKKTNKIKDLKNKDCKLLNDHITSNDLLKELLVKQLKNVNISKKLNYNDIKRISKFLLSSIFDINECSLWSGYITNDKNHSKGTYINFYFNQKKIALHRLLYLNFIGDILNTEYIKFSCINKGRCCNINHMIKYSYTSNINTNSSNTQHIDNSVHILCNKDNLTVEL